MSFHKYLKHYIFGANTYVAFTTLYLFCHVTSSQVCLVIDTLYDVRCQIIHVKSGEELSEHINTLMAHFKTKGSPIMMGGDTDVSSKGIVGVCKNATDTYLLVVVSESDRGLK